MNRRKFIYNSGILISGFYLYKLLRKKQLNTHCSNSSKRLIIIHLDGGHDGLFSIAPINNDVINSNRKSLMMEISNGIKLNDELIINKHLVEFVDMLDKEWLNIMPNVGYPNPNTSHMISSNIWQTGNLPEEGNMNTGWFSDYAQHNIGNFQKDNLKPFGISFESGRQSIFQGEKNYYAIQNPEHDFLNIHYSKLDKMIENEDWEKDKFLFNEFNNHLQFSKILEDIPLSNNYPNSDLGRKLSKTINIIKNQNKLNIYHIKHHGYDTHLGQADRLKRLYSDLGKSIKKIAQDLHFINEWKNTQILIYSEFGRSIDENRNGGTDHGTAGPVFILGGENIFDKQFNIKPIYETYNIGNDKYLKYQVDFRKIFLNIRDNWILS